MKLRDVDAIAATVKPGLPQSLLIGTKFGKYLSKIGRKPFIPIHHMEAHALTARMVHKVDFPFLVLLISGGHCLLALVEKVDKFYLLGASIDDAPGEAFDKVARRSKLHNIPDFYDICSGAALEIAATRATDPEQFYFPPSLCQYRNCNFSFAGIKSRAIYHLIKEEKRHNIVGDSIIPDIYNLCAAFQMAISRHICNRTQRAMEYIQMKNLLPMENKTLVVSGGVACNNFIANALNIICSEMGYNLVRPPPKLCTDNGIMVAWNGVERYMANSDILTNPEDIEKVDINQKAPLGENWIERVTEANLKCKWIQIKKLYAK
ncbi:probable tRNA N6-adenosine threonylcarbamoyltransferase, mitochondrial isoform X2 [Cephus cinctus]|nr:probable tRNA N6-adenosine threonylcarbamoyltransferase, mitochondrial isoform X2 [Cephus cinctus]XP_024943683.1 probable tRNA N6-adenosine threonylcarbamoyltransferase, mitochondrial isoform X2 [Cephus cinctus]XP_024943684.1 probable tRNA N6-adenosine threonylcarbamoyltransferase, mitochondrial isoform X2 [Cephus cinctus]XP_024943685.1 probable tRNA N6-adenosine threonylcarbamoyltransferase, mitochondrial isoform X2 [Cephus cinctus]XP_024943686.1 probable tRNA N6-adenosine threonylcarbamoyl